MASKRPIDDAASVSASKKAKKGFSVGPQNLPDGTYKRKADKIRRRLVENAKIRQKYDKIKARELKATNGREATDAPGRESSPARHPARQALVDDEAEPLEDKPVDDNSSKEASRRIRRPKTQPFKQEQRVADKRREEIDQQRAQIEESRLERDKRLAERDRWRRTMANARGDGRRRKLGKESTVLLERIQRSMGPRGDATKD